MGTRSLGDLITTRETIKLEQLARKTIAIDTFNVLYQFLASIRGYGGSLLTSGTGLPTSHLEGLFYRSLRFLRAGLKPVYVFDGKPSILKLQELERRKALKEAAEKERQLALERGDIQRAAQLAQRTSRVTEWEINSSKRLLEALGIPYVQAPAEGEAQTAALVLQGHAYASATQDYDTLLFGAPLMIRNLASSGKRKLPNSNRTIDVPIERIALRNVLDELQLSREQLIDLALLLGTDFNPDGFKGIGPKTAYKLIKKYGSFEEIQKHDPRVHLQYDIEEIRSIFLHPDVLSDPPLKWRPINKDAVLEFLVEELDFNPERITRTLELTISAVKKLKRQTALDQFF